MKFKVLLIIGALAVTGCSDNKKEAEIAAMKQELEHAVETAKAFEEKLKTEIELHDQLNEILDPDGETVKMWSEVIDSCEGVQNSKCEEVRESLSELQSAIRTHASLTLEAVQFSVDENQ